MCTFITSVEHCLDAPEKTEAAAQLLAAEYEDWAERKKAPVGTTWSDEFTIEDAT